MTERLNKTLPIIIYAVFCAVILGAVLTLQPGWGFMDDFGLRQLSVSFWESHDKLEILKTVFHSDVNYGRFRPVYYLWAIVFYGLFQNHPFLFNLFLTVVGLLCIPLWGKNIQMAYGDNDNRLQWLFCLSFFVFTPFWNIFMYLSLQERFYLLFGGLAVFFYLRARIRQKAIEAVISNFFLIFLVLGKETGISLMVAFCIYSIADYFVISREKKINRIFLIGSILFICPYLYFLMTRVLGSGYSSHYGLTNGIEMLRNIPLACKGILFVAILSLLVFLYQRFITGKNIPNPFLWILFPLCLISYIAVLIPWGFPTYMLSPVALFLFPTLYLVVRHVNPVGKTLVYIGIVLLSMFFVIFNSIPSIEVMADKRKVIEFIRMNLISGNSILVAPPPLEEASVTLKEYMGANINYFRAGKISASDLENDKLNYLVVSHECGPFKLENLNVGTEVYRNATWSVRKIIFENGSNKIIQPDFEISFFNKFKKRIRGL